MIRFIVISIVILFLIALVFYRFPLVQVCGNSMYPTFKDGEIHLGKRLTQSEKIKCKKGRIYVFRPPYSSDEKYVIKRLYEIEEGKYFFLGDNSDCSYDSRYYGYVDSNLVVAEIIR